MTIWSIVSASDRRISDWRCAALRRRTMSGPKKPMTASSTAAATVATLGEPAM
jgi:hypothetical protein